VENRETGDAGQRAADCLALPHHAVVDDLNTQHPLKCFGERQSAPTSPCLDKLAHLPVHVDQEPTAHRGLVSGPHAADKCGWVVEYVSNDNSQSIVQGEQRFLPFSNPAAPDFR
jgi:hypothetical protein